jgi:hypothetical protein
MQSSCCRSGSDPRKCGSPASALDLSRLSTGIVAQPTGRRTSCSREALAGEPSKGRRRPVRRSPEERGLKSSREARRVGGLPLEEKVPTGKPSIEKGEAARQKRCKVTPGGPSPPPTRLPSGRRASRVAYSRFSRSLPSGLSAERLREELTLAKMDRQASDLDEMDVEGILGFAERVLPRAADLGCRPHSSNASDFSSCSFPRGLRSTERTLFEPP